MVNTMTAMSRLMFYSVICSLLYQGIVTISELISNYGFSRL